MCVGLRGGTSGAAEESLRTGEAKISDKAPQSHEIRGRQIPPQKIKNKKDSWRSQRMLLSGANESGVSLRPALKLQSGIEHNGNSANRSGSADPSLHAEITARRSCDDVNTGKKKKTTMQNAAFGAHVAGLKFHGITWYDLINLSEHIIQSAQHLTPHLCTAAAAG